MSIGNDLYRLGNHSWTHLCAIYNLPVNNHWMDHRPIELVKNNKCFVEIHIAWKSLFTFPKVEELMKRSSQEIAVVVELDAATLTPKQTSHASCFESVNQIDLVIYSIAPITISNDTNGVGTAVRDISVEARGKETPRVIPASGFESKGKRGGPFSPPQMEWTLTNVDDCPMDWDATNSAEEWLELSEMGGTLPPGASVTVIASILAEAALLPPDRFRGRVVFRNLTSGRELVGRNVSLFVLP